MTLIVITDLEIILIKYASINFDMEKNIRNAKILVNIFFAMLDFSPLFCTLKYTYDMRKVTITGI